MKILIADDERLICEWLQFCMKDYPEYEIVGVANNGEQALELYKEYKPDLVLTDIKMPVMGGLELLKEIKKIDSSTYVVLLTAFSEFEYVREAMRDNANEYILKTEINSQSFQEMLRRIAEQKNTENSMNEMQYNSQKHVMIRKILLQSNSLSEEDLEKLNELKFKWHNSGLFAIAVWKNQMFTDFTVPPYDQIKHMSGIDYDEYIYVIIGNLSKDLRDLDKLYTLQEYANMILSKNSCMVGVSNISNQFIHINDTILEAVSSLTLGFYKEQVKVYQPSPFINERKEKEEWFLELKRYYQEFYKKTGKEQYDYLKEILEYIAKEQACFIKDLLAFCKECVDVIYVRYIEDNSDVIKDILLKTKKNIDEASSFSELKKIVLDYAYSNIWSDEFEEKKLSHNVYKAVIYIRQHYNEPLSLEQIASEVNLNPEYLSRIFKDETGQTYSGYLSNIRMNKAENLLLHSTEKVQKIAETVGYTNVSYFSTIFKKRYGVNPYEFRRNHEKSYHDFN